MIDISVSSLVKSFELGKNILDGLSFTVNSGERVGILGHNGCGKTTLFRILAGEIGYDEGEVMLAPGKRLGLISQIPVYPEGWTTEDVLRSAHRRLYDINERLEELALMMETDQSQALLANTTDSARIFAVSAATTWTRRETASQTVWISPPRCVSRSLSLSPAAKRPA